MVFNAGSFFSGGDNAPEVQEGLARMIADHPTVRRLIVESRAQLITPDSLRRVTSILASAGKHLTVRIGIETKDWDLRAKKLMKGQTLRHLREAVAAMKEQGVVAGGYVLLNPCADLDPIWAMNEAEATIDWILNPPEDGLGMDEAYFRPVCVAPDLEIPGKPARPGLEPEWRAGNFQPATLWETWQVLRNSVRKHGRRVYLLPFRDEPAFLAVPSNHVHEGIPETLEGAQGCDLQFHELMDEFRRTMDPALLESPPECSCRPAWAS
jgi:uncharacterized Fe-S cluster-containing MiaB family protein